MKSVVIVGYGVVGKNMYSLLHERTEVTIVDPLLGHPIQSRMFDYAIVCVPTDMKEDGSADTTIVKEVIDAVNADTYIIKSTVPPGTTRRIAKETNKTVVFSPEYYGGTQHANTPHRFVILGGTKTGTDNAAKLFYEVYTGFDHIFVTDHETAELVKYAENSWLALQVTFFNTFYRMCETFGVNYNTFREALLLDDRIAKSHSLVYPDHPYYSSHCLNKDIPAIIKESKEKGFLPSILVAMISINEEFKNDRR